LAVSSLTDLTPSLELVVASVVDAVEAVSDRISHSGWAVLYLGVVTTALCNWLQTLGQREVGAEQAALIFALDPVWGAFFAKVSMCLTRT